MGLSAQHRYITWYQVYLGILGLPRRPGWGTNKKYTRKIKNRVSLGEILTWDDLERSTVVWNDSLIRKNIHIHGTQESRWSIMKEKFGKVLLNHKAVKNLVRPDQEWGLKSNTLLHLSAYRHWSTVLRKCDYGHGRRGWPYNVTFRIWCRAGGHCWKDRHLNQPVVDLTWEQVEPAWNGGI